MRSSHPKFERMSKMKGFSRLYFRILLYFLTMVLFILLAGIIISAGFIRGIESDIYNRIEENMESVGDRIDEKIQVIFSMGTLLYNEESFTQYLRPYQMMTIQQKYRMQDIRASIARNKLVMIDTIQNIFVFIDEEKVYSDQSLENSENFFNVFNKYKTYDRSFWISWLYNRNEASILPADIMKTGSPTQEILVIPVVIPAYNSGYRCVVVFNISVSSLYRMYYDNSIFDDTVYVITDKNGIVASDRYRFNPEMLISGLESTFSKSEYISSVTEIERLGWKIYSFTPVKEFTAVKRYYIIISGVVCMAFLIIGISLSYVYSRKIYIPIRAASQSLDTPKDKSVSIKRLNELDNITNNVKEIIRSRKNEADILIQYSYRYVKQCLLNIMDHKPIEDAKHLEQIMNTEIGFTGQSYLCVCYIFIFNEAFYRDFGKNADENIKGEIADVLNQIFGNDRMAITMNYSQNMYVSVINQKDINDTEMHGVVEDIFKVFQYDERYCSIRIGLGRNVRGILDISQSFEEACTALLNIQHNENNQVMRYEDVIILKRQKRLHIENAKLMSAVKDGNMRQMESVIYQMLTEFVLPGTEYFQARAAVKSIVEAVITIADENIQTERSEDLFADMGINYAAILLLSAKIDTEPVMRILALIIPPKRLAENETTRNLSARAKKYVDANYTKELSLEIIADKLNISAKHLSRSFINDTGIKLSDYISQVRVNRMKELLRSSMPMNRIPAEIGITNRATFVRIFKKIEGITPGEYRRYFQSHGISNE